MSRALSGWMSQARNSGAQQSANEIFAAAAVEKVQRQRVSAENAKKQAPIKRERIVLVALAISLPIFVLILAVNVFDVSPASFFETPPSPSAARASAQQTLDGLVIDIELYRRDYKKLPQSLIEVGRPEKGIWTYTVSGETYRIQGTLYGQTVNFAGTSAPQSKE
jgi:hypothetical protein